MILVSACLAGENCRYDGSNKRNEEIVKLVQDGKAIPVCPEVLGGLTTPRNPVEIVSENGKLKAVDCEGKDFTKEFIEGAQKCLDIARKNDVDTAILKSKSGSCGYGFIYDGTFSDRLIKGNGITAELLSKNNIKIFNEKNYKVGLQNKERL